MRIEGQAVRVVIYLGESDRYHGQPLYLALLELLKREGAAGATVLRGLAGFGANSRIHTATIVTLSADLPVMLVWVDEKARVDRLLPQLRQMVGGGLITLEPVEVVHYAPARSGKLLDAPVRTIMRTQVTTVRPETPVAEVVALLLERGFRSLPVVDAAGRVVGILTDGDLLQRAHLPARLGLQAALTPEAVQQQLVELEQGGLRAGEIMSRPVVTVQADMPIRHATALMAAQGLKRLPVVDAAGSLVGWVSRLDILREVAYHQGGGGADLPAPPLAGASVAELMDRTVPTVGPEARLEEVLQALEGSRGQRVVVVDAARHVVGILTDGDILIRSGLAHQPGVLARLRALVAGGQSGVARLPGGDLRACDLMTTPVIKVRPDTSLGEALAQMLQAQVKRLPVVDAEGRLLGLLGRASVLRGLLPQE